MHAPQITAKSWLMIASLGLVWGATFMVIERALWRITPFWLAAARIGFAAIVMSLIWGGGGFRLFAEPPTRKALLNLTMIGVLSSAVPFMLLSWRQQSVTSGFAGISMATVAIMVLPLAHLSIPNERMTPRKAAGFALGFAGVLLLMGGDVFASTGVASETWGRVACLLAAGCYALSSVSMRLLPDVDPIGLATVLLLIGAAIVLPAAVVVEGPPPLPDAPTLTALAVLGLLPTAAANMLRPICCG